MKKSTLKNLEVDSGMEDKIVTSLERISQAFRVFLWNESKEHGLSPIQIQILIFLAHHSGDKRKVSYLAEEFDLTKATISDAIKSLEQKDLISKEHLEEDNRSYIIHLTKKGKDIAHQTSIFSSELKKPIASLASKDKEEMFLHLLGIIRHLNQAGVITIQRMCYSCRYYESDQSGKRHFCQLMKAKLSNSELRVDCPEHAIA